MSDPTYSDFMDSAPPSGQPSTANNAYRKMQGVQDIPSSNAAPALEAEKELGVPAGATVHDPTEVQARLTSTRDARLLHANPDVSDFLDSTNTAHRAAVKEDLPGLAKVSQATPTPPTPKDDGSDPNSPFLPTKKGLWPGIQELIQRQWHQGDEQMKLGLAQKKEGKWATGFLNYASGAMGALTSVGAPVFDAFGDMAYQWARKTGSTPEQAADISNLMIADWFTGDAIPGVHGGVVSPKVKAAGGERPAPPPKFTAPHEPDGPGGGFATTADGHVADANGNPVHFPNKRAAALWIVEQNQKGGQQFEVGLNGPGDTRFVREAPPVAPDAGRGASPARDEYAAMTAERDLANVEAQQDAIEKSKFHEKSPQTTEAFAESKNPGRKVWVNPDTLLELEVEQGHTPLDDLEIDRDEFNHALQTGNPIEMSYSKYVAALAGKPYASDLHNTSIFREGGVSAEEAKDIGKEEPIEWKTFPNANEDVDPVVLSNAQALLQSGQISNALKALPSGLRVQALDTLTEVTQDFGRENELQDNHHINRIMDYADDLADDLEKGRDQTFAMRRIDKYFTRLSVDHPDLFNVLSKNWETWMNMYGAGRTTGQKPYAIPDRGDVHKELVSNVVAREQANENEQPPPRTPPEVPKDLTEEEGQRFIELATQAQQILEQAARELHLQLLFEESKPKESSFKSWEIAEGYNGHGFEYTAPNGEVVTGIITPPKPEGGPLEIDINSAGTVLGHDTGGANRVGIAGMRELLRHIQKAYPNATEIIGLRTTGARSGETLVRQPLKPDDSVGAQRTGKDAEKQARAEPGANRLFTGEVKKESPIVGFKREAKKIEAKLPPVLREYTRLWRGNRPGEVGSATRFTNDLPGIALPFQKAYGGPLSYVDIPTQDLEDYEQKGAAAPGAEFNLPAARAAEAKEVDYTPPKPKEPDADAPHTALGMAKGQFGRYATAIQDSLAEAENKLFQKIYNQIKKERLPKWKAAYARNLHAADMRLLGLRDIQAWNAILKPGSEAKFDPDLVEKVYGKDMLNKIPESALRKGGTHPDIVAEDLGYDTGEELLQDLARLARNAGKFSKNAKDYVKMLTEQLSAVAHREAQLATEAELGQGYTDPTAMHELVMRILPRIVDSNILIPELEELSRLTGQPLDLTAIKSFVADHFDGLTAKQAANPRFFSDQAYRHIERATKELQKGNHEDAFKAMQRAFINRQLLRQAWAFKKEYERSLKLFAKLAKTRTSSSINQGFLDAIHEELGARGYNVPTANIAWNYFQWAEAQRALDIEVRPEVDGEPLPTVEPRGNAPRVRDMGSMTSTAFQEFTWRIKSMVEHGKEVEAVIVAGEKKQIEEIKARLAAQALSNVNRARKVPELPNRTAAKRNNFVANVGGAFDEAKRMVRLFNELDNYNPNGLFNEFFTSQMRVAGGHFSDLEHGWLGEINKAIGHMTLGDTLRWDKKIPQGHGLIDHATGREAVLTPRTLIGYLFYRGSEKGVWHLTEGGNGFDLGKLDSLFEKHLTPKDVQMVEKIVKSYEDRWSSIVMTEKDISKIAPEKAKVAPFTLHGKDYDGWYWHLQRDPVAALAGKELLVVPEDITRTKMQLASTPKGHTIKQTNALYPIDPDWETILHKQLSDVARRIAYARPIKNMNKLLRLPEFQTYIATHGGPNAMNEIVSWMQRQVGASMYDPRTPKLFEAGARALRLRTYHVMTMLNLGIGLEHGTSIAQTGAVIGAKRALAMYPRYAVMWAGQFLQGGLLPGQFTEAASSYMRARGRESNRELRDEARDAFSNRAILPFNIHTPLDRALNQASRKFLNSFFNWINQTFVAKPTWYYNYHLARMGKAKFHGVVQPEMDHDAAVNFADLVVQESHGSGMEMDLSSLHSGKGNEFLKLATMFGVFAGTRMNLGMGAIEMVRKGDRWEKRVAGLESWMWIFLALPLVARLVTDRMPKRNENKAEWFGDLLLESALGNVIGGSTVYWGLHTGMESIKHGKFEPNFAISAVEGTVASVAHGIADLHPKVFKHDKKAVQNMLNALAFATYAPTGGQFAKTAQVIADMQHRNVRPQALIYGPSHEKP